jgi:CelD/BcsL family acetyltransferase involved in cellulose biosynthesis
MISLTVEEKCGAGAIGELRDEWQDLYRASDAAPFSSWEWAAAWQRWLNGGPGGGATPRVVCAYSRTDGGAELVGLLALGEEERRLAGLPLGARRLTFLGGGFGGADYLDVLARPEHKAEAAAAILNHLARQASFDVLDLDGLASDSPMLRLIERWRGGSDGGPRGLRYELTPRYVCPVVELEGGWEAALKRSRRAENFRRRLRQLRAREGFEFRSVTRPEEALPAFDRFFALHEARWAGQGGSEATGHAALAAFHRDLVVRLAEAGLLCFDELWAEGACRASIYGIDDGRRYYFYNSGYEPAWRNASPGLVLLGLSIEGAARRGVGWYDFLRGEEPYKFDWATTTRETVMVRIARRSASAALLTLSERAQRFARDAAQVLLPTRAAGALRSWRRAWKRERSLALSDGRQEAARS